MALSACYTAERSDILSLLDQKVREAEASIKAELHAQLYGRKPESNPLRQAIADAYDQVTQQAAISSAMSAYKTQITEQIFSESPILTALNRQEKEVTDSNCIARAAVAKRQEKRAKARTELVGDYLEDNDWESGDVISWTVNFKSNPDKTYHYVAVRGGANWFITGDACRYDDDSFTAKLVALSLDGKVVIENWDDPL